MNKFAYLFEFFSVNFFPENVFLVVGNKINNFNTELIFYIFLLSMLSSGENSSIHFK